MKEPDKKRVVFCVPTIKKPFPQMLDALEAAIPCIEAAGWECLMVSEVGNSYISNARNTMLRKALDAKADVIVFIDHDVSFRPQDMLKLVETPDLVAAGTYRFKDDSGDYMGLGHCAPDGRPIMREDGCIRMWRVPGGFLKVTKEAVGRFMEAYPHLIYGFPWNPYVDLFNHGAHKGLWYGEDYAFCRNWTDLGGEIWCLTDAQIDHHSASGESYPGNFLHYLQSRPGGALDPAKDG